GPGEVNLPDSSHVVPAADGLLGELVWDQAQGSDRVVLIQLFDARPDGFSSAHGAVLPVWRLGTCAEVFPTCQDGLRYAGPAAKECRVLEFSRRNTELPETGN
ncbi:unnamed protein product, partial [Pleuronectes platessa]